MRPVAGGAAGWPRGLCATVALVLGTVLLLVSPGWRWSVEARFVLILAEVLVWAAFDFLAVPLLVLSPVVIVLSGALIAGAQIFGGMFLGLLVARVVSSESLPRAVAVLAASEAAVAVPVLVLHSDQPAVLMVWAIGLGLFGLIGRLLHRQERLTTELAAAHDALREHAVMSERQRIAREIHDVIAHLLAVTMLHVTAARLALPDEPEEAAESLAEAERLGRESMTEVRRTVGLLRRVDEQDQAPLPTAADLDALIERFRTAGMSIESSLDPAAAVLSPSIGLTVYRVAQESLSNAARHAPGTPVSLTLTVDKELRLRVSSGPAQVPGHPHHAGGLGIQGMRERVALIGGTLDAGGTDTGWLVDCRIPTAWTPSRVPS